MKATYSTIVLDLSHARASNTRGTTGPAAQVDSSATSHQDRDDRRRHISSPSEPQEGHRGLSLTASLLTVVCAVGDLVVEGVFVVGAGVAFQPSSQCDRTGQEEDVVQNIEHDHDDGVNGPFKVDRGGDEVEQRYDRECGSEHAVVDRGGVACERHGDDVTDQGHDKQ